MVSNTRSICEMILQVATGKLAFLLSTCQMINHIVDGSNPQQTSWDTDFYIYIYIIYIMIYMKP